MFFYWSGWLLLDCKSNGYSINNRQNTVTVFTRDENEIIVIIEYEPDEIHFGSGKKKRSL